MQCEEVVYKVPVLRWIDKGCDENGFYSFKDSWEPLVVGCTCAKPRTSTVRSTTETDPGSTPPPK